MFYFSRQFEQSLEQCRKTIELDPNFFASHFVCGLALEQMGQHDEALAEFQAAVDLSGRLPLFLAALGHGYAAVATEDGNSKSNRRNTGCLKAQVSVFVLRGGNLRGAWANRSGPGVAGDGLRRARYLDDFPEGSSATSTIFTRNQDSRNC